MKKIAVFDLDKTLYDGGSMKDFLFGFIIPQKKINFMNMVKAVFLVFRYATGLISHNKASLQTMQISASVLQGRSVEEVASWQQNFFSTQDFYEYVPELFALLKKNNFEITLISASIEPIVSACAATFGVGSVASTLVVKDGKYTGKIEKLMNEDAKAMAISKLLPKKQKSLVLAFGDSSGDVAMLEAADHGFLFEPFESRTESYAKQQGIHVVNRYSIVETVKKVIQ